MTIGAPKYLDSKVQTLSGNLTLTVNSERLNSLDPGGSGRNVTLPAVANGLRCDIQNTADGSEDLAVKNSGGTTIVTVSQNEDVTLKCDGTTWLVNLSKGAT